MSTNSKTSLVTVLHIPTATALDFISLHAAQSFIRSIGGITGLGEYQFANAYFSIFYNKTGISILDISADEFEILENK